MVYRQQLKLGWNYHTSPHILPSRPVYLSVADKTSLSRLVMVQLFSMIETCRCTAKLWDILSQLERRVWFSSCTTSTDSVCAIHLIFWYSYIFRYNKIYDVTQIAAVDIMSKVIFFSNRHVPKEKKKHTQTCTLNAHLMASSNSCFLLEKAWWTRLCSASGLWSYHP